MEKKKEKKEGKGWWDEECREMKKEVEEELKTWKREGRNGKKFRRARNKLGALWKEKKRREKKRWEKEIEGVRTEGEVWKIVNRERKRRKRVNEEIAIVVWDNYFRGVLGGVNWRVRGEEGRGGEEDEEEESSREEVWAVIKRLKEGKATGGDGIPNEVWKYGGEVVRERI